MMVRMSLIYMAGRYGASAITLVALSLYTRLATPAEYGLYALVLALATALYATFGQWLRQVLLRFASTCETGSEPLPSVILQTFVLIACVLAPFFWLAAHLTEGDTSRAVLLALPLFGAMGVFELSIAWLQLRLRSSFYVGMSFLRTASAALLGLAALWAGFGATGLVVATTLAYIAGAAPVLAATRFGMGRATAALGEARAMLSYGVPLAISAALGAALALADRAIIAALISTEAAGLYAAPYDLATRTLQVLLLAINLAGTPLIVRAFEQADPQRTDALLTRQWTLLFGAGLPVAIAMTFMPHGIASVLLGSNFRDAGASLMPLVAAATFLQGLESFYFSFAFALSKRPLRQTGVLLCATVINVGLTLWLVPRYGIIGGAWATLASAAFSVTGSALAGWPLRRLPFAPGIIVRIAAAGSVMALVLWWADVRTPLHTFIAGAVALATYTVALVAFDAAGLRRKAVSALRSRLSPSRSAGETL